MSTEAAPEPDDSALLRDLVAGTTDAAAVGTLLAGLAHAGNNRLTVILSCLELLQAHDVDPDDSRSAVELAIGATRQLADDFSALLAVARRDPPARRRVDLAAALRRAGRIDALLHPEPLERTVDVPPGLEIDVERERLDLLLLRLHALARRRGAAVLAVRGGGLEVASRTGARPALRKGKYCCLQFEFAAAAWPQGWLRPPSEPGHVVERLDDPDGLEFAAAEAVVATLGGEMVARGGASGATLELYLPA